MAEALAQTSDAAGPTGAPSAVDDERGEIDVDISTLWERIDSWVDGTIRMIPNIVTALIILLIFVGIAWLARKAFIHWAASRDRKNLGTVFGGFIRWVIISIGVLLGLTIVVPTLNPGDMIAGLGVGSVAIGFAFKDILQNWLAGMLLLFRQPFEIGDQIIVEGFEGTVERIETRATILKTYDGRQILIPNSEVYTNSVQVNTAFEQRRSEYDVGIGYGDNIDEAVRELLQAVKGIEGVLADPAPEVLVSSLGDFAVLLRARWWTQSPQAEVIHVRSRVLAAAKKALDDAGIDMPYETQVHLLHDQSENADGNRKKQREGWPAGGGEGKDPEGEGKTGRNA